MIEQVRESAEDAAMMLRLTRDFRAFLRTGIDLDEARALLRQRLRHREQNFLRLAELTIYRHPRSPFRRLLVHAGCQLGDLRTLVVQEGLEGALQDLAARGVYVSADEFSGRRPAVRGSSTFEFASRDFDNPLLPYHYLTLTSGSRGRPTRVRRSFLSTTDVARPFALTLDAHGVHRPRNVFWRGAALNWPLVHLKLDYPIEVWFTPIYPFPPLARVGIGYLRVVARLAGRRLPAPRHCDLQDPETVTRWLVEDSGGDRPVLVNSTVSAAVRVAGAARRMGRTLDRVTFHSRSEPLDEARRRQIEQVGARVIADYSSMELSALGYSCAESVQSDDLHFFADRHALVERERPAVDGGPTVKALLFTTLTLEASKIALNAESGDAARIETRACGCHLGSLGLTTHLSEIRSFEKLSTEGTSFARSNLVQILEEVLPTRFGGTSGDYQLVEETSAGDSPRLTLRVHPRLGPVDDDAVRATFLDALAGASMIDEYQTRLIRQADALAVTRLPPLMTATAKVLPLQIVKQTRAGAG